MLLDIGQDRLCDELFDRFPGHPFFGSKQIVEAKIVKVFKYLCHLYT